MDTQQKPKVIFILGGPGSGKGTQCQRMVERYNFIHYSTGDLLRQFIKTDCKLAEEIRQLLKEGKLAPSQMLVEIIKTNIFKEGENDNVYLIDGFPRSAGNYEAWKEVMGNEVVVKDLIYLDCTFQTLERRLLERGKTSGRSDDNIQTIRKRFNTYSEQTAPFLKFYKQNVGYVHHLNGQDGKDEVSDKIKNILMQGRLI